MCITRIVGVILGSYGRLFCSIFAPRCSCIGGRECLESKRFWWRRERIYRELPLEDQCVISRDEILEVEVFCGAFFACILYLCHIKFSADCFAKERFFFFSLTSFLLIPVVCTKRVWKLEIATPYRVQFPLMDGSLVPWAD